jgi:hypothetical protein
MNVSHKNESKTSLQEGFFLFTQLLDDTKVEYGPDNKTHSKKVIKKTFSKAKTSA